MSYNYRKTVTFRLAQAAKAYRQRSSSVLGRLNLHPGQDQILKALADTDGQTMGALAATLSVQPPTVTKMVARLGAQGLVQRRQQADDARSAKVFLTTAGEQLIDDLDKALRGLERDALRDVDDKDRKRIRKLLRILERNLSADFEEEDEASLDASLEQGSMEQGSMDHEDDDRNVA
ncbi:MAG: MarR family winged helix-turn-helix transcriptional regulator [Hyphomicrobiales bacterium]